MRNLSFFKDLNSLINFPKEGIYSTVLAKSESYNYSLMCLSTGTDIDTHTSTKAGLVYVLRGEGSFVLDGKEIILKPGITIFMKKNAKHSLKSTNNLAILLCLSD